MRKRIWTLVLCLCLLTSAALPVQAAEEEEILPKTVKYTVSNLDSFLALAEKCRLDSFSQNLRVVLRTDLDLNGTKFNGIPIFSGTFEGNGHTIKGLRITAEGSQQGLFRNLTETAVVQDLKVIGTVQPTGSRSQVGGIAGSNAGVLRNCSFNGNVSGNSEVGGIVGSNHISGIIENCTMTGAASGSHFVGGIVGKNSGVVRDCANEAKINDTAVKNTVALTDVTLETITSSESISAVTDIGGIAGGSTGVIRACVNRGNVGYQHMGYNIGGIAGSQSGTLMDCENLGQIRGRKEVGGIVGQLEPTALIQYEADAFQLLQEQLDTMGGIVNQTVNSVRGTGDRVATQVDDLKDHVLDAQDALESLMPDPENPEPPDEDTLQAAQNAISSSLSGMTDTLKGMGETAYSSIGAVSTNLNAMQAQLNAMRNTLGNISQTLGGSITDVSDSDTELDLTGKIANCSNHGTVLGDRNAGGIAGAIGMENDLDHEEDWTILGENSLNFESELRAVILDSTNDAQVTCKKQNGGGIVGWQAMGLVRNCINIGNLDAASAKYVGGITGQSYGFIRSCYAKCAISGTTYLGGIAGAATEVSDCRSLVKQTGGGEKSGEVLGDLTESLIQRENPLSGNLYFPVSQDLGAVNGISYGQKAEPVTREAFLAMEDLPEGFSTAVVRFRYPGGQERSFTVTIGDSIKPEWVPRIPPKKGYVVSWAGLEAEQLSHILFDRTYEVQYTAKRPTLQSDVLQDKQPAVLVQGTFEETAQLLLTLSDAILEIGKGETLLCSWDLTVENAEELTGIRVRVPEGVEPENAKLLSCSSDGIWHEMETEVHGSYLTANWTAEEGTVVLIQKASYPMPIIIGAALAVLAVVFLLFRRRKR